MRRSMIKSCLIAALFSAVAVARGYIVAQWTFENTNTLAASTGTGNAANVGGTSSGFANGTGGAGTFGWNTSQYPAQGTGSGSAGVAFFVDTTGYQDITLSFFHRASGTASRWAQIDYTLDGGSTWVTNYWNNNGGLTPHDTFYSNFVDFTSVTGANDNPDFGIRIVSIFSPLAFDQNNSLAPYDANTAYMRANANAVYSPTNSTATGDYGTTGTWRFDDVIFNGNVVPEPGTALLFVSGLALAALVRTRRAS